MLATENLHCKETFREIKQKVRDVSFGITQRAHVHVHGISCAYSTLAIKKESRHGERIMDMVYMYSGMVGYRSFVACTCTCTCTCMNCALRLCALFSTHILIAHSCMNVHVHVRAYH